MVQEEPCINPNPHKPHEWKFSLTEPMYFKCPGVGMDSDEDTKGIAEAVEFTKIAHPHIADEHFWRWLGDEEVELPEHRQPYEETGGVP